MILRRGALVFLAVLFCSVLIFGMPSFYAQPTSRGILVGVTSPSYDDVARVIRNISGQIEIVTLTAAHFRSVENLSQFHAVFINCGSQGVVNANILRQYVAAGGIVYASDHAGRVLRTAFPGLFTFTAGRAQTIRNASIVHTTLGMHMNRHQMDVHFNLDGWYVVSTLTESATVYIRGQVAGHGNRPLAFSFDYGLGRVFYTSFHHHVQANADMVNFIEYLVFRIQHMEAERNLIRIANEAGYIFDGMVFGTLDANEVSPPFYYTPSQNDFMILFDPQIGDFTIFLMAPTGEVFASGYIGILTDIMVDLQDLDLAFHGFPVELITQEMIVEGLGVYGFRILNPIDGSWSFWLRSNNPEPEQMFAVGLAERPTAALTRAMLTQVVANLENANLEPFRNVFPSYIDVTPFDWFFPPVEWATHNGLVTGFGGGRFSPNTPLTREQMVVMLDRYADFKGVALPVYEFGLFTDHDRISYWAVSSVMRLFAARIISGLPDGSFHPQATATTTEISAVFARFLELIDKEVFNLEEYPYYGLQDAVEMLYDGDIPREDYGPDYLASVVQVFAQDGAVYDNPSTNQPNTLFTIELSFWRLVVIGAGVFVLVVLAVTGLYSRMKASPSKRSEPQYFTSDAWVMENQENVSTCTNCGAGFGETSKFCVKCGHPRG